MTSIPSTEKTNDFVYRVQIKKDSPPNECNDPHLLEFLLFTESLGTFHSMDVSVLRDCQNTPEIDFLGFEHYRHKTLTTVRFRFQDKLNRVAEHDYILTTILRYLA